MGFDDRVPYADLAREEMCPLVPASARRVLDVGCHRGAFGALLRTPGREVFGIEIDPATAADAAARLDEVFVGRYPDDIPTGTTFDCVVFNDVLEHMEDPWSALKATIGYLEPEGTVLASIPNVRNIEVVYPLLTRGTWRYHDQGLLDRTHLRFFTKSSMRELFEDSGFVVVDQIPLRTHGAKRSRIARAVHLLGRRAEEFLTVQYGLVARVAA
jgi:2-polyprenyl-3-methyl-5-hydroxy-6-metoxy-1,4-benzoquinol methylase